jgi:hypothetical protein
MLRGVRLVALRAAVPAVAEEWRRRQLELTAPWWHLELGCVHPACIE